MRARAPLGFALALGVFVACGGRSIQGGDEGEAGASSGGHNQGGTKTSAAGRTGAGGSVSQAGVNQGGVATAGTTAAGGACTCSAIGCPLNSRPVPNPDGCCFHCESDCPPACPGVACGSGSVLRMLPGDCCPRCIEDVCVTQHDVYHAIQSELVNKYGSISCTDSSECTTYFENNACSSGCGIPIAISIVASLDSNLQNAAASICTPDCKLPVPPCGPTPAPSCIDNRCQ